MEKTIHVKAVPGRLVPKPWRPHEYFGWDQVFDGGHADHTVPEGMRYRIKSDGEHAPNIAAVRKALRRGDLQLADAPGPQPVDAPASEV